MTQVVPIKGFYPAEGYHQNYATLHPDSPYIARFDLPKVANLQKEFPELYVAPVTNWDLGPTPGMAARPAGLGRKLRLPDGARNATRLASVWY